MESIDYLIYEDEAGRKFEYALRLYPGAAGLVVHFSSFFDRVQIPGIKEREYRGYFHRLKMLGDRPTHNWLFVCDPYGSSQNGCYYAGHKGDLFVEKAMQEIWRRVTEELQFPAHQIVTIGSSAGANAALKFGLLNHALGIVAFAPFIDLDLCAALSERYVNIAYICPDGDPFSFNNWPYTRRVRNIVDNWDSDLQLPRLFIQGCKDEVGVYEEQILPLVDRWRDLGGDVTLDAREVGGHTARYGTGPLLHDVIDRLFSQDPINLSLYQSDPTFKPAPIRRRNRPLMNWAKTAPLLSQLYGVFRYVRKFAHNGLPLKWAKARSSHDDS